MGQGYSEILCQGSRQRNVATRKARDIILYNKDDRNDFGLTVVNGYKRILHGVNVD